MTNSELNQWDSIAKGAQHYPDRIACRQENQLFTYQKLDEATVNMANFLEKSVSFGDRIAIIGVNSIYQIITAFACWRLGVTLVPLNFRLSKSELKTIIDDCQPRLIFNDDTYADKVDGINFETIAPLIMAPKKNDDQQNTAPALVPIEAPAIILYTSGTTGTPKGARLSHRMIMTNNQQTITHWELDANDRTAIFAPLFHTGGWNVFTLPLLAIGGQFTLQNSFNPTSIITLIKQGHISVLFGVPTMFAQILEQWDLTPTEMSAIRFFISGGAPCPIELINAYLDKGINFRQGYGMTEAGPNCFYFPADAVRNKAGSVGKPMPGTIIKISEGQKRGELTICGAHLFSGYFKNETETEKTLKNGTVYTGDIAEIDQDGFFYIVGRKKEMYISGGENIYPTEIENQLMKHPNILEAAVIGIPDKKWGEVGCAFLVAKSSEPIDKAKIHTYLRNHLAHYKVPKEYQIIDALPRNNMGKVLKACLGETRENLI